MCEPTTIMATAMGGASLFSSVTGNKAANKRAKAQAKAARANFFAQRVRLEHNYKQQQEEISQAETEALQEQALEQNAILVAIGDQQAMGQSSSKMVQSAIAKGALDMSALAGTSENLKVQQLYKFKDNQADYLGNLNKIKSDLNANFKSPLETLINAGTAAAQGYTMGLGIQEAGAKAATAKANAATAKANAAKAGVEGY